MNAIPAKLTPRLVDEIDEIIHEGWYANRSELIRDAVRNMIKKIKAERLEAAIKEDVKWGLYGKE
jgi:Arc/MetJ-type ribon-helix-helix transcriptional regulator